MDAVYTTLSNISSIYSYDNRIIALFTTSKWKWNINTKRLIRIWTITVDAAAKIIDATTQKLSRDLIRPLNRCDRDEHTSLKINHLDLIFL